MITKISRVKYDQKAKCDEWLKFLRQVTGNRELIAYLQRVAGYCMTGIADEKAFFFLYGPRHGGKTTFVQTIKEVLGDYSTTGSFSSFLAKNEDRIRNDIAGWAGMRMVVASESEEGQRLATAMIKTLTGTDSYAARKLYQEYKEQKGATFKIILYGNEAPRVPASDMAFHDRCRIIPFNHTIPEEKRIEDFKERYLYPELPGILNWCIEGCLKWQKEGLGKPEAVERATADFIREVNPIQEFIDVCCIFESRGEIAASALYQCFRKYCDHEKGIPENRIETQTAFGKYLGSLGVERHYKPPTVYRGVDIKNDWGKLLDGE